jgi:hypothetical protein
MKEAHKPEGVYAANLITARSKSANYIRNQLDPIVVQGREFIDQYIACCVTVIPGLRSTSSRWKGCTARAYWIEQRRR